jgi:hypothetical protein
VRDCRWTIGFAAAAVLMVVSTALAATRLSSPKSEAASPRKRLMVRDVGEAFDAKHIEIRGVEASRFNPKIWLDGTLNLVPDIRQPVLAPRAGKHRNIYAPSIVQTKDGGWRIYYGGWDGVDTPNDRIYLAETRDFLDFTNRQTVIEHGEFQHVCNVNVAPTDHGYAMMCTAYPDANGRNKPVAFFSDDGVKWNEPATRERIIRIDGYKNYDDADINGMNVLLFESGRYRLYFCDFHQFGKVFRASSQDGKTFHFDESALDDAAMMVNDVRKFHVADADWYLMGLHANGPRLHYALSRDGLHFGPPKLLYEHVGEDDRYVVSIGWAIADGRILGLLYGAGARGSLDENRIFATWLQKKVVIAAGEKRFEPTSALGPDRQLIASDQPLSGRLEFFADDRTTLLGTSEKIDLHPGRAYAVQP